MLIIWEEGISNVHGNMFHKGIFFGGEWGVIKTLMVKLVAKAFAQKGSIIQGGNFLIVS